MQSFEVTHTCDRRNVFRQNLYLLYVFYRKGTKENAKETLHTYIRTYIHTYVHIQGVTGGTDQTSGGCSLC